MNGSWVLDHVYVLAFLAFGFLAAALPFGVAALLAPRSYGAKTFDTYECGMEPIGPAWTRYGVVYYLYALMFLAFAVDVLYLFPAAVAYQDVPGLVVAFEVILFVAILSLAIAYAWRKGVFTWPRRISLD